MNRTNLLTSAVLAPSILCAATAAAADAGSPAVRATTAVGVWIADQGNQAIREIREDLRKRLAESLKPLLPAPTPASPAPTTAPAPTRATAR